MKQYLLCLVLLVLSFHVSFAQKEGYVWAFGSRAGLDFNTTPPQPIRTAINEFSNSSIEGCASVCDKDGRLLFYTNGEHVWNRNHVVMPNGGLSIATNSAAQGGLIVPFPGSDRLYYVFSQEPSDLTKPFQRLYYSVVDMRLNNGLGDVVQTSKAIKLADSLSERLAAVAGDHCDIWVVARNDYKSEYRAYRINANGISTMPVTSSVGSATVNNWHSGMMKFSHDRRKLAVTRSSNPGFLELADFDPATGIVSNNAIIAGSTSASDSYYGVCFSPDDTKLYASINYVSPSRLIQYDISLPTLAAIQASATVLHTHNQSGSGIGDIKEGPDGKLYFQTSTSSVFTSTAIHQINNPNSPGNPNQVVLNAIPLAAGASAYHGLPNEIVTLPVKENVHTSYTVAICAAGTVQLPTDTTGSFYLWDNGNRSPIRTVSRPGSYILTYRKDCTQYTDTFIVRNPVFPTLAGQTPSCPGKKQGTVTFTGTDTATYSLSARNVSGDIVSHSTGNRDVTLGGLNPGSYDVEISIAGCVFSIAVFIDALPGAKAQFDTPPVACLNEDVPFMNQSSGADYYRWHFGDGSASDMITPVHRYQHTGTYTIILTAHNDVCSDTFSRDISVRTLDLDLNATPRLVKQNEEIYLQTSGSTTYTVVAWSPSWKFPDQQAYEQIISGDSSRTYTVTAVSSDGCPDTASVYVDVEPFIMIPSAFSPNNDGQNDRFRILAAGNLHIRSIQIRNRWGQTVWQATGTGALAGWDGTWKGQPADVGVYFYSTEIETLSGKIYKQKGDLTLVR